MFTIEKNVPIPEAAHLNKPTRRTYPWHEMDVGDSFVVPNTKRAAASSAMSQFNRKNQLNMRFISYIQKDGSMRIWRTR